MCASSFLLLLLGGELRVSPARRRVRARPRGGEKGYTKAGGAS